MSAPDQTIWMTETDEQIDRCFTVMLDLQPHIAEETFVRLIRRMQQEGFLWPRSSTRRFVRAGWLSKRLPAPG